jgi:hypothetical protein
MLCAPQRDRLQAGRMMAANDNESKLMDADSAELRRIRDLMLIVLANRLGGDLDVPIAEIDDTGQFALTIAFSKRLGVFRLTLTRKN